MVRTSLLTRSEKQFASQARTVDEPNGLLFAEAEGTVLSV